MRPATPKYDYAQQAGPSSPPQTPTTSYEFWKNRPFDLHFHSPLPTKEGNNIIPNGEGTGFSFKPSSRQNDLSPRSSASSVQSSASGSPPRSLASSPVPEPLPSSSPPPPPLRHNIRTVMKEANFTLEEFGDSDYEGFDSDDESVIRPHQYEDAESDRAPSIKASPPRNELPRKLYTGIRNMNCETQEQEQDILSPEIDREAWLKQMKAEKRRKRRSSGSVQKRTFSQSIGSDTDEEDVQPVFEGANEAGSSARRLRRKAEHERMSLIFDDPPPRIDELEEPESCEEVVEIKGSEGEGQGVDRNLPYYVQDMDVDSDDEEW
ncbi:hypothetical protein LOCC1_G008954 [Lachnellula occidentalis]|uniref:Uncharacterized protein n=1 Tax=Lachnellula occidentalis TaxID=215460 RepID=A0A8H8U6G7_9HELO|nr:hypothetical protein LOCC1_G008954 [Lachnellula occidentalis]